MTYLHSMAPLLVTITIILSSCTALSSKKIDPVFCTKYVSLPESALWIHGNLITDARFTDDSHIVMSSAPYSLTHNVSSWAIDLKMQTINMLPDTSGQAKAVTPCRDCKTNTLAYSPTKNWQVAEILNANQSEFWLLGKSTEIRLKFYPDEWRWSTDESLFWYSWSVTMGANSALLKLGNTPQYVYEDEDQIDAFENLYVDTSPGYIGHWLDFAENGDVIATTNYSVAGHIQNRITNYVVADDLTLRQDSLLTKTDVVRIYPNASMQSSFFAMPTARVFELHDIDDKPIVVIDYALIRTVYYAFRSTPPSREDANAFRGNPAFQDQLIVSDDTKHVIALHANGLNPRNTYVFACE